MAALADKGEAVRQCGGWALHRGIVWRRDDAVIVAAPSWLGLSQLCCQFPHTKWPYTVFCMYFVFVTYYAHRPSTWGSAV